MDHLALYAAAHQAIEKLFGDRSVSESQTRDDLESLRADINTMIESLDIAEDE